MTAAAKAAITTSPKLLTRPCTIKMPKFIMYCCKQVSEDLLAAVEIIALSIVLSGSRSDVITVTLPSAVEEGIITLSAVIYDDLTHNQTAPSFPFASFDTVSRAAEAVLSGATPVATTKKSTQVTATSTTKTTKEAEAETEPSGKKSQLPLILALCALGGIVLTVILRLFSGYFLHLAIDGVIGGM